MMSKDAVERGKEMERFVCCGERWNWRRHGNEEEASVRGLHLHLRPCDVWVVLPLRAMSGSVVSESGSVVMSVARITTKGHADVMDWPASRSPVHGQRPCCLSIHQPIHV